MRCWPAGWSTMNSAVAAAAARAVLIDLTPIRDGTGRARLLDMVDGRSKAAFKTGLTQRPQAWRDRVEVVAMDGFTGFKTAAAEELPTAVAVMDPLPRRPTRRRRPRPVPPPRATRTTRPPRSRRRPLYRARPRPATRTPDPAVHRRPACRGRSHLGGLSTDDNRLPRARPSPRPRTR